MATNHLPTLEDLVKKDGRRLREIANDLDCDQGQLSRWMKGVKPLRFRREQIEEHFGQEIKWPSG